MNINDNPFYLTMYKGHEFRIGEVLQTGSTGIKLLIIKEVWWKRLFVWLHIMYIDPDRLRVKYVT